MVPELLSPAGSLDAVRAAVANGANAVYLGVEKFNARDEGAQLTLDDLEAACLIAHERGVRVYLTLNILVKPGEMEDAIVHLGHCIDRGIDAAIVQDIGLVRMIQAVYPGFEIHGSTQMTVHDAAGARVMQDLGIERVVLARENTIDDIRAIKAAVPDIGLETFVHGALCISYSGQCYMSGMISERSANRGSCAQSCRKDYVLTDAATGAELDRGYLISAKDLGAYDHLQTIADAGVGCLKIEGRKKKPEYVATVTAGYRKFLDRVEDGTFVPPSEEEVEPLVQIFSRGFTGGMYGGRAGRDYITRDQPDNHGMVVGTVVGHEGAETLIDVRTPVRVGDGLGFEPSEGSPHMASVGFSVTAVRTLGERAGAKGERVVRQAVTGRGRPAVGWRVVRSAEAALIERARASYAALQGPARQRKVGLEVRVFGHAGAPLKAIFRAGDEEYAVQSEITLAPAGKRALSADQLREQFGRLGETPFALGAVDVQGLGDGLFLPVSALNHLRQEAVDALMLRRDWAAAAADADRAARLHAAVGGLALGPTRPAEPRGELVAEVFSIDDARAAAEAGATEVVFDPFLRHPAPPRTRVAALGAELRERGVSLRLRTPTIVRPEDRRALAPWLALDLPLLSGHLGLVAELSATGRDVRADYAVNAFNAVTAATVFELGASGVTASVELTTEELGALVAPWGGAGFEVVLFGRPEGMTIEHCVLSAAFDRVATTCRDLCVQKHTNTELTDPTGYVFPVATDSACRNRLLHSRPIEGGEFLARLWTSGIRRYRLLFNTVGAPVAAVVAGYRAALDAVAAGGAPDVRALRETVGEAFTRGHFSRAV
jgi:putative protease